MTNHCESKILLATLLGTRKVESEISRTGRLSMKGFGGVKVVLQVISNHSLREQPGPIPKGYGIEATPSLSDPPKIATPSQLQLTSKYHICHHQRLGLSLLSYGFGAYFNILPGSEWSAIMLTYGFPLTIIGMALLGGGVARRNAPILKKIREEVTEDGKYCLVLVFEAKALELADFEKRQEKFTSFFGPGITAEEKVKNRICTMYALFQTQHCNYSHTTPYTCSFNYSGEAIDEEDMYFLDADKENDDDDDDVDENDDANLEKRPFKTKRVTRVVLNKRNRNKEKMKVQAEAKKTKEFVKEHNSLPAIINEIAKEDEEKSKRHERRVIAKQERLKSCPPCLGRHKFEPAPVQACCTLARDRYKSLQKRGIIVPTAKSGRK
ncbi:hypothetical protein LXL04_023730 [Taraxacum kok-saghyz]